jgi:hypothetical protein
MTPVVRWLSVAAGLLILFGWTLPYAILFGPFSQVALVPASHGSYLPWIGGILGILGLALLVKGLFGRIGHILPEAAGTILIVFGIIHTHQVWLHKAPTIWSWIDVVWPLVTGGLLKLSLKKG